ncbi:MAG: hypothetical protein OXC92_08275 [Flavobacteriaceae bacterium]|nr:hypothetical protein [Flavobacteriaceae bacterium]
MSTTSITLLESQNSIHITTKIFIDDMQNALRQFHSSVKLDPDSDLQLVDSLSLHYLNQHLIIKQNQNILPFDFVGKEYDFDLGTYHLEILTHSLTIDTLMITNTVLFDLFEDQKNIIHFKSSNYRKSYLLHFGKSSVLIPIK